MNVSLPSELEKFVLETVASGRYSSASEVVRTALRILEEEERWRLRARASVEQGLKERAEGKMISKDQFMAEVKERRRKRA